MKSFQKICPSSKGEKHRNELDMIPSGFKTNPVSGANQPAGNEAEEVAGHVYEDVHMKVIQVIYYSSVRPSIKF